MCHLGRRSEPTIPRFHQVLQYTVRYCPLKIKSERLPQEAFNQIFLDGRGTRDPRARQRLFAWFSLQAEARDVRLDLEANDRNYLEYSKQY